MSVVPIQSELHQHDEPRWLVPTVQRLLAWLPEEHCGGLGAIVLTRSEIARHRKRTRAARAQRRGRALGIYHLASNGQPAWIELIVDELVKELPGPFDRITVACDVKIGRVLFHEIGHHLDATIGSVGRTGEHSAEMWSRRLLARYMNHRYWYLTPLRPLFAILARVVKMIATRQRREVSAAKDRR